MSVLLRPATGLSVRRRLALAGAGLVAACGLMIGAAAPATAATEAPWGSVGDSIAAGVGAGSYLNTTCYLSTKSYPKLLDADADKQLVSFVPCNGATTADVISKQIPALATGLSVVTVSVGANDVGFSDVMTNCFVLVNSKCQSKIDAGATAMNSAAFAANVKAVIDGVRARTGAQVIVTGYPLLFWENSKGVNPKYKWGDEVNDQTAALNAKLQSIATANGATFVDVAPAFAGHGIGSSSSWINDFKLLSITTSFHPTATGYVAYANAIRAVAP